MLAFRRGWATCLLGAYGVVITGRRALFISPLSHFAFALVMPFGWISEFIVGVVVVPPRSDRDSDGHKTSVTVTEEDEAGGMAVSNSTAHYTPKPRWHLDVEMGDPFSKSCVFNMTLTIHVLLAPSRFLGCVVVCAAHSGLR